MLAEIFGMDGIIVVVVVAVVLFGGSQIPKLARSLGSARREFSEGLRDGDDHLVPVPVPVPVPVGASVPAQEVAVLVNGYREKASLEPVSRTVEAES